MREGERERHLSERYTLEGMQRGEREREETSRRILSRVSSSLLSYLVSPLATNIYLITIFFSFPIFPIQLNIINFCLQVCVCAYVFLRLSGARKPLPNKMERISHTGESTHTHLLKDLVVYVHAIQLSVCVYLSRLVLSSPRVVSVPSDFDRTLFAHVCSKLEWQKR